MQLTTHHVGICVSDLQRSLRFWCEGLGFKATMAPEVGSEWSDALEIGGDIEFSANFIEKDGFAFELLHYVRPQAHGTPSTTRNQLGFTHLSMDVDSLDAAIELLTGLGGTYLPSTRTLYKGPEATVELAFVADPDGVRIELVQQL
jgi:glyoxylase I family protein